MLRIKSFGITDVGLLRTHNEDCFDVDDENQIYVVADGMGGHNHGEVAVFENDDGSTAYHCFHDSCQQYHWRDFVTKIGDKRRHADRSA